VVSGLVSEFLEEKKRENEELARIDAPKKKRPLASLVMAVLCAVIWFAPTPQGPPDPLFDAASTGQAARRGLQLLASSVVDYHTRHGRLPRSLVEAGIDDSVMYVASSATFSLSVTYGGSTYSHSTSMDTLLTPPATPAEGVPR
jgi:hypothetical protein